MMGAGHLMGQESTTPWPSLRSRLSARTSAARARDELRQALRFVGS
jgi:hypothetical protein